MIDVAREKRRSISGAAKAWGFSVPTVRRWIEAGELEWVQLGKRRYTSDEALQRMARRHTEDARDAQAEPPAGPARATAEHAAAEKRLEASGVGRRRKG